MYWPPANDQHIATLEKFSILSSLQFLGVTLQFSETVEHEGWNIDLSPALQGTLETLHHGNITIKAKA